VGKYTAQKHSSYIDGRCSKVYYCKEEGCNNSIKYNTALYGGGRCRKCTDKIHSKLMIENNPNWKGGISFEPYSLNWTKELKEQIRKRDNHICQLCDKTQRGNNRALDVHHIDYNKKNCSEENLISLCSSCHTKTNNNRDYWMNYFNKKVLQLAI